MRTRYLTPDEVKKLAKAAKGEEWLPLAVAVSTGLRIGDVLKIRPSDFVRHGVRYRAQKTGKLGHAPLTDELILALYHSSAGSRWCFPSPKDRRQHLTRQAAWARMKRACKRAGVDPSGVSPHSLRKVFAVELLRKTNLAEVQKALQHDRIDTTELYALADWATGDNAALPLTRGDLPRIVGQILSLFGISLDGGLKL